MEYKDKVLVILILIILSAQCLLKLWSAFGKYIHKTNNKYFQDKNGLEDFYYSVYFLIYLIGIGIIYAYVSINYNIGYYISIIVFLVIFLSLLLYKIVNPALTRIISDENCFAQSKRFLGRSQKKVLNFHFYSNTFFQLSILANAVTGLVIYFWF